MRKISLSVLILFASTIISASLPLIGHIAPGTEIVKDTNLQDYFTGSDLEPQAVLLIGNDGTAALIKPDSYRYVDIDSLAIGWAAVCDSLPPVCNIKNLASIAVWQGLWDVSLILLEDDVEITYQPFWWILSEFEKLAESSMNKHKAIKYRYKAKKYPPLNGVKVEITSPDGDTTQDVFRQENFKFDGYRFYYNNQEIRKILPEK